MNPKQPVPFKFLFKKVISYKIFSSLFGVVLFHVLFVLPIFTYATYSGIASPILITLMISIWIIGFIFGWFINVPLLFNSYRPIFLKTGVFAINKKHPLYIHRVNLGLSQEQIDGLYVLEINQSLKDGSFPGMRPIQSE